jgi:hypothetical protein
VSSGTITGIYVAMSNPSSATFASASNVLIVIPFIQSPFTSCFMQSMEDWLAFPQRAFTPYLQPPVTTGFIAHYNADSWTGMKWTDVPGYGNHVKEVGGTTSISVARPSGAPAYVQGASTAWMKFPVGVLPSAQYTLFYVARYNGATRGAIFQGSNSYWLSGFYAGRAGGAVHSGGTGCGWITRHSKNFIHTNLHGSDWVLGSDRSDSF